MLCCAALRSLPIGAARPATRPILLRLSTHACRAGALLRAAEHPGLPIVGTTDNLLAWRTGLPLGRLALDFDRPEDAAAPAQSPAS